MHLGVLRVLWCQRVDIRHRFTLTHRQLPLVNHRIRRQTELVGNVAIQPAVAIGTDRRNELQIAQHRIRQYDIARYTGNGWIGQQFYPLRKLRLNARHRQLGQLLLKLLYRFAILPHQLHPVRCVQRSKR
ncbi:hypothetical protein D3C71_1387190 [compost metagenome]